MDTQIFISDFVKLTGTTLKTVLYYHKIGLLNEPERSDSGYRLYGAEELATMRMIKHLKNLGLDLKQIKEILVHRDKNKNLKEVLLSLQSELLQQREAIDERLTKIEMLLEKESENLEETSFESKSFKAITESLNQEQLKNYKELEPDLYNQQRSVFGVMDDFKWQKDYQRHFEKISRYFKENPHKYGKAIELGKRLSNLRNMDEDDPAVENLAREGAEFIKNEPFLKEMLYGQQGLGKNEELFDEMSNKYLSPAQIKHKKLIQKYLEYNSANK